MKPRTNKFAWVAFGMLAITIGFYPLLYLLGGRDMGLLATKPVEILGSLPWNVAFYGHIVFGGASLLVGWTQFSRALRRYYLKWHKILGKVYVVSALISGACGIYLSFFATGGWIASLGFFFLGVLWIFFTLKAYTSIRSGDLTAHEGYMIYSYAACFAAVSLRIWMPVLILIFSEFLTAYRIVAWLCWVPNLIFAFYWVRRRGLQLG
ncbi:DUF2306 domain-containing protein [Robiginitalea aurantiaca]|uniref:DUF2306 domain-containing protein n=1 Tax=Robiginitalea aurantiaca TaxID=3056915 RepID=A0ABT7WDN5_9FLAO|nr:DUF2306 domain-containing protein [Robiginitalea aurantiaca]MDM9631027.1 DUF2306 domain-containing protein [Robiginitalea aurantiaca]